MDIQQLGPCLHPSPLHAGNFVEPGQRVLVSHELDTIRQELAAGSTPATFELAGPRRQLFFDPARVAAGIVTCGGLCPGLNDVIRAVYMQLWHGYGVRRIIGFHYGYQGLNPAYGHQPDFLEHDEVDDIHQHGGSILSSSRGPQPVDVMVDYLVDQRIDILFTVGGDGTQRGAMAIAAEIARRGLPIAVVGIPKSIDNDISCIDRTFGFETAVSASSAAIAAAHVEAKGAPSGVGIVKLMGRYSGFIAAWATLACSEVDLTLVPELRFELDGPGNFLDHLEQRLRRRHHAVIVVAEGAGQHLFAKPVGADASGNPGLNDIGDLLCRQIKAHTKRAGLDVSIKYIDPSYLIRGIPANAADSVYCVRLGQAAAHAAMAGCTGMLVGSWHNHITHVPFELAIAERKTIDPDGWLWQSVLHATGQPDWGR